MNERHVRFTATARRHVERERACVSGLRRLYLEKLVAHLYYTFDDHCRGLFPHLVAERHHAALVGFRLHQVQIDVLVEPLEE